jgi:hypothetical protein
MACSPVRNGRRARPLNSIVSHHNMMRSNVAIAVQLGALVVLMAIALTTDRWGPVVLRDIGIALVVVGTFGISVVVLAIGLIWAAFLSWLEYRRGAFGGMADRVLLFLGITTGCVLGVYALRYWGGL